MELNKSGPPVRFANFTTAESTASNVPSVTTSIEEISATLSKIPSASPSVNVAQTTVSETTSPTVPNVLIIATTERPVSTFSPIFVNNSSTGNQSASDQTRDNLVPTLFIAGATILLIVGFGVTSCVMWRSNIRSCCCCNESADDLPHFSKQLREQTESSSSN